MPRHEYSGGQDNTDYQHVKCNSHATRRFITSRRCWRFTRDFMPICTLYVSLTMPALRAYADIAADVVTSLTLFARF